MLEERYNNLMEGVELSPELVQRTLRATRPHRTNVISWKPVLICVLCVMIVAVPVLWKLLHTASEPHDIVVSDSPSEPMLVNSPPSDELTLSVSDLVWEDESTLSFILSIRGDKVDSLTECDWNAEGIWTAGSSSHIMERTEDQPDNEQRFQITQTIDLEHQRTLPESIIMHVTRYTSGNAQYETSHEIDWSTFPYILEAYGSPIIDLGGDMYITGLGFDEDGYLTIQIREPLHAEHPTHSLPILEFPHDTERRKNTYPWTTHQRYIDDHEYFTTTISIRREELEGAQLITWTQIAGETILGDWTVTIDLPPRPAR